MNAASLTTRTLLLVILVGVPACSPACFLKPTEAFDPETSASPPDYSRPDAWAALPEREDKARFTPPGYADRQAEAAADVFFVHPTTWYDRETWNDPLDSDKSREMIDNLILAGQASAFNACCRVFAPRYRQATIGAFLADPEEASKALEVAYEDVERAFEVFVEEHNVERPFVVAAHSQGSLHAMGLLERIDRDPELRRRLVAAYIPGFSHPMSRFEEAYEHLEPCDSPSQTGCIASWDTYREGAEPDVTGVVLYWTDGTLQPVSEDAVRQCTNPITWRTDERPSEAGEHLGTAKRINEGEESSFWKILRSDEPIGLDVTGLEKPRKGLFSARCEEGVLRVPDLDDLEYEVTETTTGNYHLHDYELFYMDIRENARLRTEAWLEAYGEANPEGD